MGCVAFDMLTGAPPFRDKVQVQVIIAQQTQPLIPYRTEEEAGTILDKVAPFGGDEGMAFGRKFYLPKDGN